jgi:hypothetical protein
MVWGFSVVPIAPKNFTAGTTTVPEISNLLAAQKIRFSKTFDFIEFSRRVRRWHCQS